MDVTQMLGGGQPGIRAVETPREPIHKPENAVPSDVPDPATQQPVTNTNGEQPPTNIPSVIEQDPPVATPSNDVPPTDTTTDIPEPKSEPITNSEVKAIEKEALEREQEKKEEVKKETIDATEEYKQQVFEFLIEEQTKLEIELEKATKTMKYYKTAYDELAREHNALKYDDRKVAISEDHRPLVRLLEQYKQTPDDVNIKSRLLIQLFDMASSVDGNDYLSEMRKLQSRTSDNINNLSKNISSYSQVAEPEAPKRKITGVVMQPGRRGFR